MPGFFQGDAQAAIRAVTSTTYDYNGDWHALFDNASIADGDFNGRFISWCNAQFSQTFDNFPEAWNYTIDYAEANGWAATVGASASVDWSSYDGTNNGSVQTMTGGPFQYLAAEPINDTTAMMVLSQAGTVDSYIGTVDTSAKTYAIGSAVQEISDGTNYDQPLLAKLSDTRWLSVQVDNSPNEILVTILDATGAKVGTEVTTSGFDMETISSSLYPALRRLNDTQAVITYRDGSSNDSYLAIIDIASDTITVGTQTVADTATSTAGQGVARLSDTSFATITHGKMVHWTVSGTTPTKGTATSIINPDGAAWGAGADFSEVYAINSTLVLVAIAETYNPGSGNQHNVHIYLAEWNGSSWDGVGQNEDTAVLPDATYDTDDEAQKTQEMKQLIKLRSTDGVPDQFMLAFALTNDDVVTCVITVDATAKTFAVGSPVHDNVTGATGTVLVPFGETGYAIWFNHTSSATKYLVLAP